MLLLHEPDDPLGKLRFQLSRRKLFDLTRLLLEVLEELTSFRRLLQEAHHLLALPGG
jgi:hypothetical protein